MLLLLLLPLLPQEGALSKEWENDDDKSIRGCESPRCPDIIREARRKLYAKSLLIYLYSLLLTVEYAIPWHRPKTQISKSPEVVRCTDTSAKVVIFLGISGNPI